MLFCAVVSTDTPPAPAVIYNGNNRTAVDKKLGIVSAGAVQVSLSDTDILVRDVYLHALPFASLFDSNDDSLLQARKRKLISIFSTDFYENKIAILLFLTNKIE